MNTDPDEGPNDVFCWAPLSDAPPKLTVGVAPPPKENGADDGGASPPAPKLKDEGAE